ncbi:MAG TPA: permease-like cell division protein FtsX [Bacteroidia bacterium]|nr:permease-like cell division protein FtsX [Bacteroidia bacterium]
MSKEKKSSRLRFRTSHISSVISISLVLFLLGLLGIFILQGKKMSDYVRENIQLTVFLKDNVQQPELEIIQRLLSYSPYVKSTEYVTADEAAKRLQKDLGEDFIDFIGYNPLSASIDVKLKSEYANADSLQKFEQLILENKVVKEVVYQKPLLESVNKNIRSVSLLILILGILLLVISIALINSTIRLMIYSDRFLIKSMQLVGATKSFIMKPYLVQGFRQGAYAGIIACLMLGGLIYFSSEKIPGLAEAFDMKALYSIFSVMILTGILFSFLSTFFSVRRFLRMKTEVIYL